MSAIQSKALTKKLFQAEPVLGEKINCHLSVQCDANKTDRKISVSHFEASIEYCRIYFRKL